MGDVVHIADYFQTCENCQHALPEGHVKRNGYVVCPGGECDVPSGPDLGLDRYEKLVCRSFARKKKGGAP